jgi:hypothetical protein
MVNLSLQTPHDDEITKDMHDHVIRRHYRLKEEQEMGYSEWQYDDVKLQRSQKGVYVFGVLLVIGIALLIGFLMLKETAPAQPLVETYVVDGTEYTCEHYDNGSMHCYQTDDPDIGFGRTS